MPYAYNPATVAHTADRIVRFDILSPDGISIMREGYCNTQDEVETTFEQWKKNFEHQGYYSSNYGRIDLLDLADECRVEVI
jgi:hypothetical protein